MEISKKIKKLIKDKGVTNYQVSIDTGIPHSTISRITAGGVKKISNKTAGLLADYFHVEKEYLLSEHFETPKTIYVKPPKLISANASPKDQTFDRFLSLIESQQAVLKSQQETISNLVRKL